MNRAYVSPLRQEQAEATRSRILTAVARVLARGVSELSVPAVAREARVSVATVYRHFPSRSDLIQGLARYLGELQGTGAGMIVGSFEELEAKMLDSLRRRERLEPALRRAMANPEMNRFRAETRDQRLAGTEKAAATLLANLPPQDRRRARNMMALLFSSATASAWETLIGTPPEDAAATLSWALRRIVGEDGG